MIENDPILFHDVILRCSTSGGLTFDDEAYFRLTDFY